uniref:ADP-ribosylation factor GTPase-activating protein AGD3 n=3 Tax=Solanum TaxID=4107 RepID=M1B5E4_SOLTU
MRFLESHKHKQFSCKPSEDDHISVKEKFIHGKYAEKKFVHKVEDSRHLLSVAQQLWEGVRKNDKKTVYRLIVVYQADVNAVHGQASLGSDCANSLNPRSGSADLSSDGFFDGCSLLHLACQTADIGMVELLLQHGANINACDLRGQIPLHHSFLRGRTEIAKLLLSRGADPQAVDKEGKTPFHLVQESALDDVEIIALLKVAIG